MFPLKFLKKGYVVIGMWAKRFKYKYLKKKISTFYVIQDNDMTLIVLVQKWKQKH